MWVASSTWYAFWLTFQGKIVNQFRLGATAEAATHVYVRQLELHPEVHTADPSFLVRLFRFLKGSM